MEECIFCRIVKKEISAAVVYEDEEILAFTDIAPQAPVHIQVIPKAHIPALAAVKDYAIMGKLIRVLNQLAKENGVDQSGYRTVINNGRAAGQAVDHLHLHLLGGRPFRWPPG